MQCLQGKQIHGVDFFRISFLSCCFEDPRGVEYVAHEVCKLADISANRNHANQIHCEPDHTARGNVYTIFIEIKCKLFNQDCAC